MTGRASRTNLPVWPAEPCDVDPTGRSFAVVAVGREASGIADAWCARLPGPAWLLDVDRVDDARGALQREIDGARVSWRLMVAGPEADVLVLRALALAGGAVEDEIRCHVTSTTERIVRCVHCGSATRTTGARVDCAGCGHELVVHEHLSREHAAYLGTRPEHGRP